MKTIGWLLGIALCALFVLLAYVPEYAPAGLSPDMLKVAGIAALMACFWITEVIPIPATSIIPLAAFPLLGVMSTKQVAPAYGDRMIILLMGGFFIATVIEKVHLHKRIALNVVYRIGTKPRQILLGFMISTAFLSMWISNTATTLMMLPIVLAVVDELQRACPQKDLATAFLLAIAYAASVGGVGTPIGTPPNLIMLSQYNALEGVPEISFANWMVVGIPCVVLVVAAIWGYMVHRFEFPSGGNGSEGTREIITGELEKLGRMTKPERITLVLFAITSLLWIFRKDINLGGFVIYGWSGLLGLDAFVDDATVAILMAVVMFSFPIDKEGNKLLDWKTANKIPWGMLLLFGGGIAVARAFQSTGLSTWMGGHLEVIRHFPVIFMVAAICLFMTFLTEVTSNTAVTTIMMPILAITADTIGQPPALLMIPAAISASFAFMLPVATAPNAIMYSTERFTIAMMARVGFALNLIGAVVVTTVCYFIGQGVVF